MIHCRYDSLCSYLCPLCLHESSSWGWYTVPTLKCCGSGNYSPPSYESDKKSHFPIFLGIPLPLFTMIGSLSKMHPAKSTLRTGTPKVRKSIKGSKPWIKRCAWGIHSTYPWICSLLIALTSRGFPIVSHCFPYDSLCQSILKQHGFLANLGGSMMPCRTVMIGLALWCCPWHGASSRVGTCWWLWPHGGRRVCNSNFKDGNGNILSRVNGFHIWNFDISRWIHLDICFFADASQWFFFKKVSVMMERPKLVPESLIWWTRGKPWPCFPQVWWSLGKCGFWQH